MKDATPTSRSRRYPWREKRRKLLLVFFLIAIFISGGLAVLQWRSHIRTETLLATLRASGVATNLKELKDMYPTPPQGENAAEDYLKIFDTSKYIESMASYKQIAGKMKEESENAAHPATLSEALRAMVREYVNANTETLRLLHEAAKHPNGRFPLNYSDPIGMELPHLAKLRHAACLLKLEAMLATDDKDFDKAVESIHAMLAAGDTLRQEPVFISQLMRNICHSMTVETLHYLLSTGTLTEDQLSRLNSLFSNQVDSQAFSRGLQGEYIVGMAYFDQPERLAESYSNMMGFDKYIPGSSRTILRMASMTGWTEADRSRYLAHVNTINTISRLPVYEAIPALETLENQADRRRSWMPTISGMLFFPLARAVYSFGRDQAQMEFASAAIALERYQLFASKLPDRLDELVPSFLDSVPQDPFDGEPLRYRRTENGYLVYSIGYNQRDDGGAATPPNADRHKEGDLLFTLER